MKDYLLALDAGGTFLKAGLFEGQSPVAGSFCSHPANSNGTTEEVHAAYTALLAEMRNRAEAMGGRITGVAVDIPGPFDYKNGISQMKHKYTAIYGIPLCPWFVQVLGDIPVRFLHDSAAFILGAVETDSPYRRIAGVMLGTGLGFALTVNGKPCLTDRGTPLVSIWNTPYRDGIAEDYISARAIVRHYNELAPSPLASAKEIGDRADAGDPLARQVYEDMGRDLGTVVRGILRENEMEALYLGGQISRSYPVFGGALREALGNIPSLRLITPVRTPDLVHLVGAARFWRQQMQR